MQRLKVQQPIRQQMGNDPLVLLANPQKKVKAVCKPCNNGWMSDLEESNIPLIGNLMQDVALTLDGSQQYKIVTWAVKMSMIGDFLARSHRPLFFAQAEREQLRVATNLPPRTYVWLGRHTFPDHIGFWGTNCWSHDKSVNAFVTTVLFNYLVVQVINLQCTEQWDATPDLTVNPASGPRPWPQMLTEIWPTTVSAQWPPAFSFKNDGEFSIFGLVRRYSYGEDILGTRSS